MTYKLGLDVGSTTIKAVVLDESDNVIYKSYERHKSLVREMAYDKIIQLENILKDKEIKVAITGSAGHGIATIAHIDLVQEVFATTKAVKQYFPQSDVVIELGGEDAKIIFLNGALEERMNSTCAGGTGAFIDQMASLLNVDLKTLDELSLKHTKLYPIASRCGVFAKSDIQPLINQGADKANIAASIFQAVVDQTITGLAQGRRIDGNILFLGGPLSFNRGLRQRFIETLKIKEENAFLPELAPYFVALGAAIFAKSNKKTFHYESLKDALAKSANAKVKTAGLPPLFKNDQEYIEFNERHNQADVEVVPLQRYTGNAYLGIDAGSTTTKIVLLDEQNRILYSNYTSNQGNPIDVVKEQLTYIYEHNTKLTIKASAVTGYGEDLIKQAFHLDSGVVETIAHYTAAKYFQPNVDFIIDIGGQDMKCFKIKDGRIDEIILNEACSSGCGSFIETFAKSLGYDIKAFAQMGLLGKQPVDLGSRCTVFMNSSVKEAQKNGASVEDISAGLALSVVKNALYKVIRIKNAEELGDHIVVQGGTFLNDTILRSFELELHKQVVRPKIAGLMGAYGAALIAKKRTMKQSSIIDASTLKHFSHTSKAINCQSCTNHCNLTINIFEDGKRLIAGNKCERPISGKEFKNDIFNVYRYKLEQLYAYNERSIKGKRGKIGIPMVLNMYENLPFWHAFFTQLGYEVVISDQSSKALYNKGQHTIPSDTVCYPAKLVHGHIYSLLEKEVPTIFYPALTYNFDEGISDNCFNCPVVAYYPENIASNIDMENTTFLFPFISLNDRKNFILKMYQYFKQNNIKISRKEIKIASACAYQEYEQFKQRVRQYAKAAIQYAQDNDKYIICLAGRPYHIDPEINHGLANVISNLDCVVISEDAIAEEVSFEARNVLNQWTYHARLYQAAKFVSQLDRCELIQLVSFGCGLDSITSDEIREILRENNKLYTQIKIDEIDNLGAAKIRIRSLLAAMKNRGDKHAN
ncbi:MAG: 2-hydroxyglutaryl-CoA dehydratase [Erysipelotrichia bacterium]|nr:2-hydroxyglutaryl-CoA dehydratase [Erysipelotrichia bacterium]NCC55078.1 2-hydroxyglutaryl-CoA dehydratase [Erysipelotrichia bacterium]